ncbi:hypothetical protein B0H14DRAFT_2590398 [Mycena olivaceomarginata]|nr:hypothetical protein B0H14DRAFT_2590398 [Mycena olivaceomarginata]
MPRVSRIKEGKSGGKPSTHKPLVTTYTSSLAIEIAIGVPGSVTELPVMDQRAERMVHNPMVEVTCKRDSAQVGLAVPSCILYGNGAQKKLLPNREYHERMMVLCVNNGEWLPDEWSFGNIMSMVDGCVAKNPGRG